MFDLSGKTAVVVGGTSGIGLALSKGLARAGANVVPTGRRLNLVEDAVTAINAAGGKAFAAGVDVSSTESLQTLLATVLTHYPAVDILVNCAGRTVRRATVDVPEEEWNAIMDTNLTGTLRSCQVFGRHMMERRSGRVINIGSLTSFIAMHEVAAYAASKAAVASLTKSLAIEWAPYGICVNAIAPGVYRTDLNAKLLDGTPRGQELLMRTPMKRFGKLDELVGACVYLASDEASFTTGHILAVDGGFLASGVNQ